MEERDPKKYDYSWVSPLLIADLDIGRRRVAKKLVTLNLRSVTLKSMS